MQQTWKGDDIFMTKKYWHDKGSLKSGDILFIFVGKMFFALVLCSFFTFIHIDIHKIDAGSSLIGVTALCP